MNFDLVEEYRFPHPLGFEHEKGNDFGFFMIPGPYNQTLAVMVAPSDTEWQHVSVSLKNRCPNWPEMCFIKDLFWDEDDIVVQFHPKKSEYVNNAKTCLHLWRWTRGEFPTPPSILVGLKETDLSSSQEKALDFALDKIKKASQPGNARKPESE